MKRRWHHLGWAALAILAGIVMYRAASVASHTDGGWELLRDQTLAGLPPFLTGSANHQDTPHMDAVRWIMQQADRVEAHPNSTAADFMGAALAFIGRESYGLTSIPNVYTVGRVMWLGRLTAGQNPTEDAYRVLLVRAGELARKATELEPNQPDWWRLRCLIALQIIERAWMHLPSIDPLLFESALRHDSDNALYDYLAGRQQFIQSLAERQPSEAANASAAAPADLEFVFDLGLLEKSRQRYEQAMAKTKLMTGVDRGTASAAFIKGAPGTVAIKSQAFHPWVFGDWNRDLFGDLATPPRNGPLNVATEPEIVAIANWFNQLDFYQRFAAQLVGADGNSWAKMMQLDSKAGRGQLLTALESETRRAWYSLNDYRWEDYEARQRTAGWTIGSIAAAALGWMMIGFAIASYFVGRYWTRRDTATIAPGIGILTAIAVFAFILAVTLGLFGFIPSYQPKFENDLWPASIVTAVAFLIALAAVVGWCARTLLVQGRLPKVQRSWLYHVARWVLVIVCSMLFIVALFTATDPKFRQFGFSYAGRFPSSLYGSTDNYGGLDERVVARGYSIAMAIAQWGRHDGLYSTALVSMALITLLNLRRLRRNDQNQNSKSTTANSPIAQSLRMTGRPALVIGLLLVLLSLACSAQWISCLQDYYEHDLARLSDPNWQWKEAQRIAAERAISLPLSAPNQPGN